MSPELLEGKGSSRGFISPELSNDKTALKLGEVASGDSDRLVLGIEEIDRVQSELREISEISMIRYHQEVLDCLLKNGDYEGRPNTLKDLLDDMGERDAGRGKKNNIVEAVHGLSEHGLVRTKQAVNKGPNGDEHIIFAPLNKPGNFIRLNTEKYEWYESSKPSS